VLLDGDDNDDDSAVTAADFVGEALPELGDAMLFVSLLLGFC
jgi:hypothetical protein